ncbi:Vegetative incompatibility protein HET-E-1 [Madurella mycetomatis]|uniref:Vegetative incompatibility protein HET-E-1 n=1 Tax=Madurella mycetomatis TaxID=100816 RepID=A0A175VWZ7_9PEZI|nr:Vegetative incompatibility protein HET-E-1 [Madurella mycetomatis]
MSKTEDLNLCYFFCKSDNLEQSNALNLVRAFLHQLLTQRSGLATTAEFYLKDADPEDMNQLWDVYVRLTQRDNNRRTICILDGIDECEAKSRGQLLTSISRFIHTGQAGAEDTGSTGDTNQASGLKIVVTSRPENQIKVAFEKMPRSSSPLHDSLAVKTAVIRLQIENETDAVSRDVTRVIKSKIDGLIERGLPPALMEAVQERLVAKADRTFLWVSLMLHLLEEKVETGASRRGLDEILNARDIFDIYTQLLESSPNSPRARKMLNIILAATRALTLDEISVALAVIPTNSVLGCSESERPLQPGTQTLDDIEYGIVFPFEDYIKSLCGHFVRIIGERVYLVHETAREFLLSSRAPQGVPTPLRATRPNQTEESIPATATGNQPFQHSFRLIEAKALLLDICVTYLYCLAKDPTGFAGVSQTTTSTKSFLKYVARAWMVHFSQIKHRLQPRDFWYFQSLCHPVFPAFKTWIKAYWEPNGPPDHLGVANDEVQDYYIRYFSLDHDDDSPTEYEEDEKDKEAYGVVHEEAGTDLEESWEDGEWGLGAIPITTTGVSRGGSPGGPGYSEPLGTQTIFGSNPASVANYNFPLRVGATGVVSLDVPRTPGVQGYRAVAKLSTIDQELDDDYAGARG